jgi:hypothetical protein
MKRKMEGKKEGMSGPWRERNKKGQAKNENGGKVQ